MNEFYLTRKTLNSIAVIMQEFSDVENVKLTVDNSSGIGTTIKISFQQTINDFDGQFVLDVTDESDW